MVGYHSIKSLRINTVINNDTYQNIGTLTGTNLIMYGMSTSADFVLVGINKILRHLIAPTIRSH